MSGVAEALGVIASVIEIARFASAVTQFISEISDDTSGIKKTLVHFQNTIAGVKNVFENIRNVIRELGLGKSDHLVRIVLDSAEHCEGLLSGLKKELPELAEDAGIGRKTKAALVRKLNGKVIGEQLDFLKQYMQITQLALTTIESRKISTIDAKLDRLESVIQDLTALPAYSPDNSADYNRLRDNIDNFRDVATKEKTLYEPDARSIYGRREDTRSSLAVADQLHPVVQDLLKDARPSAQPHNDTMDALESKGMLYKAAHAELSPEEDPKTTERRADLLIKCPTVRSHQEALAILRDLWESELAKDRDVICPKRLGRVGSKLARLYLDSQSLGHSTESQRVEDRERADNVLHQSLEVLMSHLPTLRPFPYNTVLMVGELLITLFKETGKASVATSLQDVLPQRLKTELAGDPIPNRSDWPHSGWPRTFEPLMPRSLTWCGEENIAALLRNWPVKTAVATRPSDLNLKFDIRSPDFRFDKTTGGISPLQLAVIFGEKDVVEEMLREVEEVDIGYRSLITPLMETSRNGRGDIAEMLLKRGASVERVDSKKRTALHLAQTAEAIDGVGTAKLYLDAKADSLLELEDKADSLLELKDNDGKTALYLACEAGNGSMVKLLVGKYNADVDVADPYGKTALHATVDAKEPLGERFNIAKLLLEAGADPDTSDSHDHTPLGTVSSRGHADLVALLLEHKADPNRPGQEGRTPLIEATKRNLADVVLELRRHNADPNKADAIDLDAYDYFRKFCPATSKIKKLFRDDPATLPRSLPRRPSHTSVRTEPVPRTNTTGVTTPSSHGSRRSTVPASEQPLRRWSFWRPKDRREP